MSESLEAAWRRNRLDKSERVIQVLEHNMKVVPDDESGIFALAVKAAIPLIQSLQQENARLKAEVERQNYILSTWQTSSQGDSDE